MRRSLLALALLASLLAAGCQKPPDEPAPTSRRAADAADTKRAARGLTR